MFLRNTKKNKRRLVILGSAFIALFLAIFLFDGFPPSFATKSAAFFSKPLLSLKNKVSVFMDSGCAESENIFLKQKIMELKTEENKELKSALSRADGGSFILGAILSRPGYGIYNALIIDAGFEHGVKEGMPVTAFGYVLLGHVSDVASKTSRIKLVSYPEKETNIFIDKRVSAIATGLGGENLEIILPHTVEISTGDNITTLGTNFLFLGIVEEIVKEAVNPFQKIIFRLPVNIQELRYVFLIKD